jgi:RNA polymerase sigma-70 factor (ECF subfamily)
MSEDELSRWFVREILPLEPQLISFLRRNWRDNDEIDDLRQETYARVFDAAAAKIPASSQAFLISVARNLLIDRARRRKVVSIEAFADMDAVMPSSDELCPERHHAAWSELLLLRQALKALPVRCREVVQLRKIQGLSQREVAQRMGITEDTVERQVSKGIRALAEALGRGPGGDSYEQAPVRQGVVSPRRERK